MMRIQVIGIGCATCQRLETDVRAVVAHLRLDAQVERVDDLEAIMRLGLLALPGLAVDGRVIATGYSGRKRIEQLLGEAREGAGA